MCNRITTAFFTRRIATNLQLITYSRIIVANPLEVSITYLQLPTIVPIVVTISMFSCSDSFNLGHPETNFLQKLELSANDPKSQS